MGEPTLWLVSNHQDLVIGELDSTLRTREPRLCQGLNLLGIWLVCTKHWILCFYEGVKIDFASRRHRPRDFYFPSLLRVFVHGFLLSLTIIFAGGSDVPLHEQVFVFVEFERVFVVYRSYRLHLLKVSRHQTSETHLIFSLIISLLLFLLKPRVLFFRVCVSVWWSSA